MEEFKAQSQGVVTILLILNVRQIYWNDTFYTWIFCRICILHVRILNLRILNAINCVWGYWDMRCHLIVTLMSLKCKLLFSVRTNCGL